MHRLKITLKKSEGRAANFPYSYGDMLAAAVFARLKGIDYNGTFAVSQIDFDEMQTVGGIQHTGTFAKFEISFLCHEPLIEVMSMFSGYFSIGDGQRKAVYEIIDVKSLPEPIWREEMEYKCLSPIVIPHPNDRGNHDYLKPGDHLFEDIFFDKVLSTYLHFSGKRIDPHDILRYVPQGQLRTKLQDVMMNNSIIKVRGIIQFFKLIAPIDIQKMMYYGGAGAFQSKGFGCVGLK